MQRKTLHYGSIAALLMPCLLAGCYVKVDKGANGEDKDVEVHMPVGGVQVHQSTPSAADMGLPTYPGATILAGDHDNSADVHVGFGDWQLTLRVAKYQTADPQARVTGFYRTALGQYGDVLECKDGQAVGTTAVTREGLSCSDKHSHSKGINLDEDDSGFSLRAGSKRHQHMVAIKPAKGGGTQFTLLHLDLPAGSEQGDKEE